MSSAFHRVLRRDKANKNLDSKCDTYYGEALAIVEIEADTVVRAESRLGSCEAQIRCLA